MNKGFFSHRIIYNDDRYFIENKTDILFVNHGTATVTINRNIVIEPGKSHPIASSGVFIANKEALEIKFENTGTKKLYAQAIELYQPKDPCK